MSDQDKSGTVVLLAHEHGITVISPDSPLTRLNYFDGKLLRAEDLETEQRYVRRLVQYGNQAGGLGVVHGMDVTRGSGDLLNIAAGMAIDASGRVLLLPGPAQFGLAELIEKSRGQQTAAAAAPSSGSGAVGGCEPAKSATAEQTPVASSLYLIVAYHGEGLCGHEEVYKKLCEDPCSGSSARPYLVEGVVIRAVPLELKTALITSTAEPLGSLHERSLIAAAYFADENGVTASQLSGPGIRSGPWCAGAPAAAGEGVPLAVLSYAGGSIRFLDMWTARRERIVPPPRRYWEWRLGMRPWDVFLAQVLQFQCHLLRVVQAAEMPAEGPCQAERKLISEAATAFAAFKAYYEAAAQRLASLGAGLSLPGGAEYLASIEKKLTQEGAPSAVSAGVRALLKGGIVELPSAGFLPVVPVSALSIDRQVRAWLGEGVDLRFCAVAPDYIPHAFEEAQHMRRISLVAGLDNPNAKPEVDILVPGGKLIREEAPDKGMSFEGRLTIESAGVAAPAGSSIGGTVVDVQGSPVAGVQVTVMNAETQQRRQTVTDAAGHYSFAALDPGAYVVTISSGTSIQHTTNPVQLAAGHNVTVNFRPVLAPQPELVTSGWRWDAGVTDSVAVGTQEAEVRAMLDGVGRADPGEHAAGNVCFAGLSQASTTVQALRLFLRGLVGVGRAETVYSAKAMYAAPITHLEEAPPPGREAAVWLAVSSDSNVLDLPRNGTANVELRFCAGEPDAYGLDTRLLAKFTALRPAASSAGITQISGKLAGSLALRVVSGDHEQETAIPVTATAAFVAARQTGKPPMVLLLIAIPRQTQMLEVVVRWSGDPLRIEAKAAMLTAEDMREIYQDLAAGGSASIARYVALLAEQQEEAKAAVVVDLKENAAVRERDNELHRAALSAAGIIARALGESEFAEAAERQLFPPAPVSETLRVEGVTDWVMFRRRREAICGKPTEEKPAPRRFYRVYHLRVPNMAAVAAVRKALLEGAAKLPFQNVGLLEFEGGVPSLARPAQALEDWRRAGPGNTILYGAIASKPEGAADGIHLGLNRMESLVTAVAQVSQRHPQAVFEPLLALPQGLAAEGADGVIVLATMTVTPYPYGYRYGYRYAYKYRYPYGYTWALTWGAIGGDQV